MSETTAASRLGTEASIGPHTEPARPPSNLPIRLTSFVGRQAELAAVSALLGGQRLVTLTGVGGSGKTRLAAQLAADQVGRWPDGVWWVELETITDPAKVAEVVAATVRVLVEPVQGALRSLTAQLRNRRMLVCLDNCEQVLVGAAQVAEALLRSNAEVTVLTTSRIVLRRLAVFAGGFGVEAARAVAAAGAVARDDVLHALGRLVDKSLVVAEERDGESRYRLLETIRQSHSPA
jgi:predicted ATPase